MDGLSLKIGVVGGCGRLGRLVLREVLRQPGLVLAACATSPGSADLGRDAGELIGVAATGVLVGADVDALCEASDAIIDFSTPQATVAYAAAAAARRKVFVTGTTGLDAAQQACVQQAALHTAVVQATHMSLGANLLIAVVEQLAAALDAGYDVEVLGKTHRAKVDVPSGTALALARAAARGRGVDAATAVRPDRPGTEGPRPPGSIGVATLRAGEGFSEHVVLFAGRAERMEISHSVLSYEVCAEGALRAAVWARAMPPGLYGMADVLGIQCVS